jgi:hypothetical protein
LLHSELERSTHFQWVNPLFRLGHFLCRHVTNYQRVGPNLKCWCGDLGWAFDDFFSDSFLIASLLVEIFPVAMFSGWSFPMFIAALNIIIYIYKYM